MTRQRYSNSSAFSHKQLPILIALPYNKLPLLGYSVRCSRIRSLESGVTTQNEL